ncbi:MAG: hypothetical protein AUI57_01505 [Candidatus Rokubacteria bacterium 13_1_40CM_2_68_8]|nr:MAG: hypothetical protein AUI57_01505 [Candidatus Rokubacteria bacterium 13_1_40CM_2_68_8]
MRNGFGIAVMVFTLLGTNGQAVLAQTGSLNGREGLTRALQGAWLPLESGLVVSAREGTPLSGKYEIDDGAFQLSVYTSKPGASSSDAFLEVIVDYSAGIVVRAEPITDGGDLTAAQAQKAAMDRARRSLAEVTAAAVKANTGYRAVSATPGLDNGRPVAEVTLVRGDDWKVVIEPLD